jgi:DNA-3-methyladenine glycosylase I
MAKDKKRCDWLNLSNYNQGYYIDYHDKEWGTPTYDDRMLFELIVLEGFQAGLSWSTILKKRDNFRKAFDNFDYKKVAKYNKRKVESLLKNEGIIRNRMKINSAINNAKVFIEIRKEFGTFSNYIWEFVDHKPIDNKFKTLKDIPAKTELSDKISKDLKKRGMSFIGSTIMYAYMQSIGLVNDHQTKCFRYKQVKS